MQTKGSSVRSWERARWHACNFTCTVTWDGNRGRVDVRQICADIVPSRCRCRKDIRAFHHPMMRAKLHCCCCRTLVELQPHRLA